MTLSQLYQLIDDNIRQNYNEEITGPIDNSVRHAIVDWVRDQIGDLSLLNTSDTSDVVAAINEVITEINNNQNTDDNVYGSALVRNSPIGSVSGLTGDYIIVNDSGTHYFGVKKSLKYDFVKARLYFVSDQSKHDLDTPDTSNANYDFWNVGSISNLPSAGEYEMFDVWFVNKDIKYIKADGSVPFEGDQSMGGFQLTNLGQGTDGDDAARRDELTEWNGMTW